MQHVQENDLTRFHRFLTLRLETGNADMTPEEALDLWRIENPPQNDVQETTIALQEALRDMASGDDGIPWEEFDRDFRSRRNLGG